VNKTDTLLLIAVLVVALALGATIFFIYQAREERVLSSSREAIEEIDMQLERGYMSQAADTIEKLAKNDISAAAYLRLLKRTDILRRQTGSWELFKTVTREGHRSYRGRNDLFALYVYALLRSGNEEKAVELTGEREIEGERWQDLREELNLYVGEAAVEEERPSTDKQELYAILESESPEPFFRLYRQTGNKGFLLDAILLHAGEGRIPRAWELLERASSLRTQYPELTFFLAIDAGHPEAARRVLKNNDALFGSAERLLLQADIAFRLSEYELAETLCERLIRDYPEQSWRPYHNAVFLKLRKGEALGTELLDPSTDFDGKGGQFFLNLAQLLIAYDRTEEAQKVLKQGSGIAEDSEEYRLVMEKAGETVNPERYKALLRMLVNRDGGEKYAKHLAWFYLGIEDYRSLGDLLEYYGTRYGTPPWHAFYRGVLAYRRGNHPQAAELFTRSIEGRRVWQSYYNAALAHVRAGNIREALNLLEKALTLCGEGEPCDTVYFARADIYMQNGEYQKAQDALGQGFEVDPDDIEGQLLEEILNKRMR